MKFLIVGCGKIGSVLLSTLVNEERDIVAIDSNPAVVRLMLAFLSTH